MFKSKITKELIAFSDDIFSLLGMGMGFLILLIVVFMLFYHFPVITTSIIVVFVLAGIIGTIQQHRENLKK